LLTTILITYMYCPSQTINLEKVFQVLYYLQCKLKVLQLKQHASIFKDIRFRIYKVRKIEICN
jgi:hypothetical protein